MKRARIQRRTPLKGGDPIKRSRLPRVRPTLDQLLQKGVIKRAKRIPQRSSSPRALLDAELTRVHSMYIRKRAAQQNDGVVECFICDVEIPFWEDAVNMHFQARGSLMTKFSDIGCQAGCSGCNGKPNGDRQNYARRLDARYGPGTAEELTRLSKETFKPDREWYEQMIAKYTALAEALPN